MKGIVFSEFIEMVEDVYSPEVADQIIDQSNLPSGGAYTSVATYDHAELLTLLDKLSILTRTGIPELVKQFGMHMLGRFSTLYPAFFVDVTDTFSFLGTIENHVHVEVKKLYSDAELPSFETVIQDANHMIFIYSSNRPFADLAHGLILGAIEYFGENIEIERIDLESKDGHKARFNLTKKS